MRRIAASADWHRRGIAIGARGDIHPGAVAAHAVAGDVDAVGVDRIRGQDLLVEVVEFGDVPAPGRRMVRRDDSKKEVLLVLAGIGKSVAALEGLHADPLAARTVEGDQQGISLAVPFLRACGEEDRVRQRLLNPQRLAQAMVPGGVNARNAQATGGHIRR